MRRRLLVTIVAVVVLGLALVYQGLLLENWAAGYERIAIVYINTFALGLYGSVGTSLLIIVAIMAMKIMWEELRSASDIG